MGAIILWLAELVGGVTFKLAVSRLFAKKTKDPEQVLTAEASKAEATVAQQSQIIKGETTREEIDKNVDAAGAAAARDDLRKHWTAKD